jgi:hypothetical protein
MPSFWMMSDSWRILSISGKEPNTCSDAGRLDELRGTLLITNGKLSLSDSFKFSR